MKCHVVSGGSWLTLTFFSPPPPPPPLLFLPSTRVKWSRRAEPSSGEESDWTDRDRRTGSAGHTAVCPHFESLPAPEMTAGCWSWTGLLLAAVCVEVSCCCWCWCCWVNSDPVHSEVRERERERERMARHWAGGADAPRTRCQLTRTTQSHLFLNSIYVEKQTRQHVLLIWNVVWWAVTRPDSRCSGGSDCLLFYFYFF